MPAEDQLRVVGRLGQREDDRRRRAVVGPEHEERLALRARALRARVDSRRERLEHPAKRGVRLERLPLLGAPVERLRVVPDQEGRVPRHGPEGVLDRDLVMPLREHGQLDVEQRGRRRQERPRRQDQARRGQRSRDPPAPVDPDAGDPAASARRPRPAAPRRARHRPGARPRGGASPAAARTATRTAARGGWRPRRRRRTESDGGSPRDRRGSRCREAGRASPSPTMACTRGRRGDRRGCAAGPPPSRPRSRPSRGARRRAPGRPCRTRTPAGSCGTRCRWPRRGSRGDRCSGS